MTIHQDRDAQMTADAYLDLLGDLAITAGHSRSRVSNDNPMSESQFNTMKYQPDSPRRFQSLEHARLWCEDYVDWYNFSHHQSGVANFTPAQVFIGQHHEIAGLRQEVLSQSYQRNPKRFVKGSPTVKMQPNIVYINPVLDVDGRPDPTAAVNFPTLEGGKSKLLIIH